MKRPSLTASAARSSSRLTLTAATSGNSPHQPAPSPLRPSSSLRSISIVTALAMLQLLLQFATQVLLARYFGAGGEMDAYVAALSVPVVIATILSGSLGYVLVPAIAQQLASGGPRDAAAIASQIGFWLLSLSLLMTGVVAAAAPGLVEFLCPGFSAIEQSLTAALLRIVSLLIVASSLIAYLHALFHSYKQFLRPAVAGVVGTLLTLGYVVLAHHHQGIFAVAWGVVLGAVVAVGLLCGLFLTQIQRGGRPWPLLPSTRRALLLLAPLVLGAIYWRLDPLLDRFLGSYLPEGSIAHMGYAWRLVSGLSLIGTSGLSIVAFPAIAAHVAAQRPRELNSELAHALRFLVVLLIPVCLGLTVFAAPVVRLLFEHGKFTASDTATVAWLVSLYVIVIFGTGWGDLLSRTMYALNDVRTPVIISAIAFTVAAAVKIVGVRWWGVSGLVAATSLYYLLSAVALSAVLLARLSRDMLAGVGLAITRSLFGSLAACSVAALIVRWPNKLAVLPAAVAGAAVYISCLWLLGDEFAAGLMRRVAGRSSGREGDVA